MSQSTINVFLEYRRTRLPHGIYLPLTVFLATAAHSGVAYTDAMSWASGAALCYALVFQFRLWDDLADIDEDRLRNPARLLCRLESIQPAKRLLIVVSLAAAGLILLKHPSISGVLLCGATFATGAVWHQSGWRRRMSLVGRARIQLLKYPLFVLIAAPAPWLLAMPWLAISMLLVYLTFLTFEFLDDDRIKVGNNASGNVRSFEIGAYLSLISVLWFLPLGASKGGSTLREYVFVALMLVGVATLVVLYKKMRAGDRVSPLHYSIFFPGFLSSAYSGPVGMA